ncbi:hypothetical protein COCSADRAFT_150688 [Bipolaris sorokiniana ND90Pr]|uniref:PLD phosphodiesterase domain-containing protein n=1 Tax=Cochliobolus sativus (strain ND90Pr / ATCC 201652) TaxID=665912 RepID=M2SUX5_COCSN|nr:uncharacterized protein COCSADRAFT_150688 [Bipolaris sorokiniana ND90Pr]EMD60602.1 hypothetical protein COCSADRAFT_150688 [Bipolaris sorokiniana ND90Pr]
MAPAASSPSVSHFNEPFISALDAAAPSNASDDPSYYARYPRSLITTSNIDTFMTGTGSSIYESFAPLLESADHELILVTCFWARSASLDILNSVLRKLSTKAVIRGTQKIRVRLCFSSSSIFQKLFHSQGVTGQTYPPSTWVQKLGLPDPSELHGLNLEIKSIFLLPFSVMHPKFIIVDRKTAILPSCNISWEEWFEGAITLTGPIVTQFLKFYRSFWERKTDDLSTRPPSSSSDTPLPQPKQTSSLKSHVTLSAPEAPTVFLPSPHHRNPTFSPLTSSSLLQAPPTPLNLFVLTLFSKAERKITIQTPNLTSPPVLSALLRALARGVDVRILTSKRLMILEQLVTAGTTTTRCVRRLIRRYRALSSERQGLIDEESAIAAGQPGRLVVSYWTPLGGLKARGEEGGEAQQSHFKMVSVDEEVVVLGSGNLDRASWFTSQELGVAFFGKEVVSGILGAVEAGGRGRGKVVFDSGVE